MKKLTSGLLAILILLTACLPLEAAAAGEDEVLISTVEDWRRLAEACVLDTWSAGKTVRLTADLEFPEGEFLSIPLFSGAFEGGGHMLRGVTIREASSVAGTFRQLLPGSSVSDLTVEGEILPQGGAERVGGVAGILRGTLRNCAFSGTVSGKWRVGGLCGEIGPEGLAEGCAVSGSVSGQHRVGGLAGENAGTVLNCVNRAEVNTSYVVAEEAETLRSALSAEELIDVTDVGGVAGYSSGTIRGCENEGAVGFLRVGYNVGGVAGRQAGLTEDCVNRGEVRGRKDVGGVVGQLDPDGNWSFRESTLQELQDRLAVLETSVARLLKDAEDQNGVLSQGLTGASEALSRADAAAETLSEETAAWLNENMAVLNELSLRISQLLEGMTPVAQDLSDFMSGLSPVMLSLQAGFGDLSAAMEDSEQGFRDLDPAMADFARAAGDAAVAAAEFSAALEALRSGLGDPEELRRALRDMSKGLDALEQAGKEAADDLERLEDNLNKKLELLLPEPDWEEWEKIGEGLVYSVTDDTDYSALEEAISGEAEALAEAVAELLNVFRKELALFSGAVAKVGDALAEAAGGAGDLLSLPDPRQLEAFLRNTEESFSWLGTGGEELSAALTQSRKTLEDFGDASDKLSGAAERFGETAVLLDQALGSLRSAARGAEETVAALAAKEPLALTPFPEEDPVREELFRSLADALSAVSSLSADMGESPLFGDLQSVSDGLFSITGLLLNAAADAAEGQDREYMEDISESGVSRTAGTVARCGNEAPVDAETNVGGVVGAITVEFSFDLEDELDLSSLLSGGAKYLVYAAVRGCSNSGSVLARKTAAGGIAGRMDFGAVLDSASGGDVTSSGDYAGGIVGWSQGTVADCRARVNLSAANYVGGIAGYGGAIRDCLAMPYLAERTEWQGAVAGDAEGPLSGNYYALCAAGGVGGFSFSGQAEEVSWEELAAMSGESELFTRTTVTFVVEGRVVDVVAVPLEGKVDRLPEVADRDGKIWVWDSFENRKIIRNMTVGGSYHSPVTTLTTGEDPPLFLAEGVFRAGHRLEVSPWEPELPEETVLLAAYTLTVSGYEGGLTVRMREARDGKLYVSGGASELTEADFARDGSYIVFELPGGGSFCYVAAKAEHWPLIAAIAGALAVLATALILLIRRARKKKDPPAEESAEV